MYLFASVGVVSRAQTTASSWLCFCPK